MKIIPKMIEGGGGKVFSPKLPKRRDFHPKNGFYTTQTSFSC